MALIDKSSIVIPKGSYGKANVLMGYNPQTESLVNLDVTRNTAATRVNEQGLIENVPANVPRRDFLLGGCGDSLIEPQRTNLLTYSEQFDNAAWDKQNVTVSSGSSILGLDGWEFTNGASTPASLRLLNLSIDSATAYTYSVFVDTNNTTSDYFILRILDGNDNRVYFNTNNFGLSDNNGAGLVSSRAIDYGGGIYRIEITCNSSDTDTSFYFYAANAENISSTTEGEIGAATGAQLEEGSYATSYIPTVGSTVTRNADVISRTSIASLLGDSEGSLFVEASWFDNQTGRFQLDDGTDANRHIILANTGIFRTVTTVGASLQADISGSTLNTNTFYKIATRYAVNDFALYVNSTLIGTDNGGNTFSDATLNELTFDNPISTSTFYGRIRQLVVFDQALTNAELAEITS